MKLASLKEGGRDGTLVVVDKRLKRAVRVPEIAKTFQQAIENWQHSAKKLLDVYTALNHDPNLSGCFALDEHQLAAPLPRAFQWVDGSAYVNHVELVRKARGAKMPENFRTDPLMYQGGSDGFLGPRDDILIESTEWGIDFESEIAIITDDVPMGISPQKASKHIKLLMLVNDVSLRKLIPGELAKGFGFFHGKPATAFSPAAVTPDELGDAWKDEKVHLPLITILNGKRFGAPDAGVDMTFNFSKLISHAAKSRFLGAGTIIGSGTISNLDRSKGSSCLAEKRMLEILAHGEPKTPFMQFRDRVSYYLTQNDLKFVITSALKPSTYEVASFVTTHGDGVKRWAMKVEDVQKAFEKAVKNGAIPITLPHKLEDEKGFIEEAGIKLYDDTELVFINNSKYKGIFRPFLSLSSVSKPGEATFNPMAWGTCFI